MNNDRKGPRINLKVLKRDFTGKFTATCNSVIHDKSINSNSNCQLVDLVKKKKHNIKTFQ